MNPAPPVISMRSLASLVGGGPAALALLSVTTEIWVPSGCVMCVVVVSMAAAALDAARWESGAASSFELRSPVAGVAPPGWRRLQV